MEKLPVEIIEIPKKILDQVLYDLGRAGSFCHAVSSLTDSSADEDVAAIFTLNKEVSPILNKSYAALDEAEMSFSKKAKSCENEVGA